MDILIFTTRQLCYNSGNYFAHRLGVEFEKMGFHCIYCEIPENAIPASGTETAEPVAKTAGKRVDCDAEEQLKKYLNKKYLAIIDFNSKLPRLVLDDNSYYLDSIDAPFYNFILDHPLYHHSTLSCTLRNYHVFTVDENHCRYIKRHYPHIQDAIQLELGADCAKRAVEYGRKEDDILIIGTYRNPDMYMEQIMKADEISRNIMLDMIRRLEEDTEMTVEDALFKCDNEQEEDKALILNSYYMVEMYYRNSYRKKMVDTLVKGNYPISIAGEWWDGYSLINQSNIRRIEPVRFADSYGIVAEHRVLADSSPFFKRGVHDRVYAGMANHTAVLSDYNLYRDKKLHGIAELYDQRCNNEEICDKVENILCNDTFFKELTDKAYDEYNKKYSWNIVAGRFIKHFLSEY